MRKSGIIDLYIHEQGFGFIKMDNRDERILVRCGDVKKVDEAKFKEGLPVTFERFKNRAINVKPAL